MRGHNEGSIFLRRVRRVDGSIRLVWYAVVSTKRGRRSKAGPTKVEAQAKLAELLRQRDLGQGRTSTLSDYLTSWLAEVQVRIRPRTYENYSLMAGHIAQSLGGIRLADLTVRDVEDYMASVNASPNTVIHHRAVLRQALNDAMRHNLLVRNVAALARPPRAVRKAALFFTAEQVARLFAATRSDRLHPLWVLAITTGQRQGELLGLRWSDVDLEGRTITIDHQLSRHGDEFVLAPPKTRGSRHVVPLTERAANALLMWQVDQMFDFRRFQATIPPDYLVFTTPGGEPWARNNLLRAWYRALEDAQLPRIRFHDLRHTAASLAIAAGYSLEDVKQMLGHSTIVLTSNTYTHPLAERLRQVADGVDAIIGGKQQTTQQNQG